MAKVTQSLHSKTENTVTINWSSDSTVDMLWYSIDNGASWTSKEVASKKSGTYTIYGLRANFAYKIKTMVSVKGADTATSTALSVTTYNYPYCTDAPSFIIGDGATLKFYNPLNRTFDFTINGNGQEIYTWTGKTGTSVSGIGGLGNSFAAFYNSIPYHRYADYSVIVKYADSAIETAGGTYSADEDDCEPKFSTFSYRDTNTSVVSVTGSDQVIVEGLSNVAIKIAADKKMVAKNGALPYRYSATVDDHMQSIEYSADKDVEAVLGTVTRNGVMRFFVRALDTRGFSKQVSKEVVVVPYAKPDIVATLKRKNNFESQTTLTVGGTYSRVTVNGADKNQLQTVQYRYKEKGGAWSSYVTMTTTASAGEFTCTDVSLNLDNTKAYELEVKATDKLGNSTEVVSVDIGQAIFFISTNQKKCFINGKQVATLEDVSVAQKSNTLVDVVFPVGSVYVTDTNTNPYKLLGRGAWTLIDKEFASAYCKTGSPDEVYFAAAENCNDAGTQFTRSGHTIRIRQAITSDLAMEDANSMVIGSFYWENIGVTNIATGIVEHLAYADGANSGIVYNVAYDTGEVKQVDTFDLATVPSDKTFYLDFTIVADKNRMIDSYCDKFYWKRTS